MYMGINSWVHVSIVFLAKRVKWFVCSKENVLILFVSLFLTYLDDEPYFQDRDWFDALIYFHWMLLSVKTSSVF